MATVDYTFQESKRLGAAIISFLEQHLHAKRLAPDQTEGLSVAMQCLALVFDAKPTDAKDIPELMSTFNKAAGDCPKDKEPTADELKNAEEFKAQGNSAMKDKKYSEAIDFYTKAIENNKTSEVYYCNRAAAYTNMNKFHEALDDCKRAIAINEDYAKAFSRMGLIYSKLQFFDESVTCYKEAIKLEGDNEGYKKNLEIVEAKVLELNKTVETPTTNTTTPSTDPTTQMMGTNPMMGGMGPNGPTPEMMQAYQAFAQNPNFGKMAEQVMSNPQMKGMIDNFFKDKGMPNPSEMGPGGPMNPMEAMGSSIQSPEDMQKLMEVGQEFAKHMEQTNPEMINQLRESMMGMGMGPSYVEPGTTEDNTE